MKTPFTDKGLKQYDELDAVDAVVLAWNNTGANAAFHIRAKASVRQSMPVLARALDRLSEELFNESR